MASKNGIQIKAQVNKGSIENHLWDILNVGTNYDICMALRKIVDPYVPYDTGRLSKDVDFVHNMEGSALVYNAPYASKCYYGDDIHFHTDKHPLATAYWDKVAMQTERERFVQEAEQIVKKRAKEVGQK